MRYVFTALFFTALGFAITLGANELQHRCTVNHVVGDWLK